MRFLVMCFCMFITGWTVFLESSYQNCSHHVQNQKSPAFYEGLEFGSLLLAKNSAEETRDRAIEENNQLLQELHRAKLERNARLIELDSAYCSILYLQKLLWEQKKAITTLTKEKDAATSRMTSALKNAKNRESEACAILNSLVVITQQKLRPSTTQPMPRQILPRIPSPTSKKPSNQDNAEPE